MIVVYKFTSSYMTTCGGTFQWRKNHKRVVPKRLRSAKLCSEGVIHVYRTPLLAVLMDSIHAGYLSCGGILWEAVTPEIVADDGTKIGVHELTLKKRIEIPTLTPEQRVRFAILAALGANNDADFTRWAGGWFDGSDRSWPAARYFEGPTSPVIDAVLRTAICLDKGWAVNEWVGQAAAYACRANPSLDLAVIAESVYGRKS